LDASQMPQKVVSMPMDSTDRLVGVVVARNAQSLIGACLGSLSDLDGLLVVDNRSTDETASIARNCGAKVVPSALTDMGLLRAFARGQVEAFEGNAPAHTLWMVMLDADERLPATGVDEIRAAIAAAAADVAAFAVPIQTFLGDRWLRWGGYYPAARARIFRVDAVRWAPARVHERPSCDGVIARLAIVVRHHSYRDLAHLRAKTRRYAALAAADDARQGLRRGRAAAAFRTGWRFLRVLVFRQGWRMGRLGWRLASAQARGVWWRYRGPPAQP
jgi:glycosyltransferase involved in cell wall biosynthesis